MSKTKTKNKKAKFTTIEIINAHRTIAKVAAPLLKELRAVAHGFAMVDYEDRPAHLAPAPGDDPKYPMPSDYGAWLWVLDEMHFAMDYIAEDRYFSDDDEEYVATKDDDKRVMNGCRLFGKYFTHLWD